MKARLRRRTEGQHPLLYDRHALLAVPSEQAIPEPMLSFETFAGCGTSLNTTAFSAGAPFTSSSRVRRKICRHQLRVLRWIPRRCPNSPSINPLCCQRANTGASAEPALTSQIPISPQIRTSKRILSYPRRAGGDGVGHPVTFLKVNVDGGRSACRWSPLESIAQGYHASTPRIRTGRWLNRQGNQASHQIRTRF